VTFNKDGTMSWSGGMSGTYKQSGYGVTLTWPNGVDNMVLRVDLDTMDGSNKSGWKVRGTRQKPKP
jgi:hypothetical protein